MENLMWKYDRFLCCTSYFPAQKNVPFFVMQQRRTNFPAELTEYFRNISN